MQSEARHWGIRPVLLSKTTVLSALAVVLSKIHFEAWWDDQLSGKPEEDLHFPAAFPC